MYYRNPYIGKPRTAVWSDGSNASQILLNEFFGVTSVTVWGKIKLSGTFTDIIGRKFKTGGTFSDAVGYKVKIGGTFVDLV